MRVSRSRFNARARPKGHARAPALTLGQYGTRVAARFA
jgi:hypothetical protein